MFTQMFPPLILPMDSRLMSRSGARVNVAQTHRFPEFLMPTGQALANGEALAHFCEGSGLMLSLHLRMAVGPALATVRR